MIFDEESASDAPKFLAPPKLVILENKLTSFLVEIQKKRSAVEVIFGPKSTSKTRFDSFTPSPRIVERKQTNYR